MTLDILDLIQSLFEQFENFSDLHAISASVQSTAPNTGIQLFTTTNAPKIAANLITKVTILTQ